MDMLRSIGKQSGKSVESVRKKRRIRWEGFAERGGFKPGMKESGGEGQQDNFESME